MELYNLILIIVKTEYIFGTPKAQKNAQMYCKTVHTPKLHNKAFTWKGISKKSQLKAEISNGKECFQHIL